MSLGCQKRRVRRVREREVVELLRELGRDQTFVVFGRHDDEAAEIVDRLIELARNP